MTVRLDGIKLKDNQIWINLLDLIYPVGSYYMSAESTSPASRFGGTWAQIKDRMLIGAGDIYTTINGTGGSASVTLATTNLPSHTHTIAHTHTLNGHTHGMNHRHTTPKLTHTVTQPVIKSSGTCTATGGSHRHTFNAGDFSGTTVSGERGVVAHLDGNDLKLRDLGANSQHKALSYAIRASGSLSLTVPNHTHSFSTNVGVADHNASYTGNSINTANTNARTSTDGNTDNTSAASTETSGSTGSGTAIITISPYYIAYIWKRTA